MDVKLTVVGGKASKSVIPLKLPTIIGRSREAELTIAHPMISRQHCHIYEKDGLLWIRDMGSLNGTVVQGQRIKESPLPPDREFTVGPLTFRAQYEYEGDLAAVPPAVLAEEGAAGDQVEEAPDFESVDDVSPHDPQTVPVGGSGSGPDFSFLDDADGSPAADAAPAFSPWSDSDAGIAPAAKASAATKPAQPAAPAQEEEPADSQAVEESEEEEPEPTPPPNLRKPEPQTFKEAAAEAEVVAEPAAETEPMEEPVTPRKPRAVKKKAQEPWYVGLFAGFMKKREKSARLGMKSKGKPTFTAAASPPEEEPALPPSEPKAAAQPQTKAKASAELDDAAFLDFLGGGPK
jgi:outer membrane biosynthesis protein TonB